MLSSGKYRLSAVSCCRRRITFTSHFFCQRGEFERRTVAHDLLRQLQRRFRELEVSRSLIEVAYSGMQMEIDDQMKKMPPAAPMAKLYRHGLITARCNT